MNSQVTLEEFEELAKAEYRVFSGYEINGMNMFSYDTGEGDYVSFVVENDGKVIELSFGPVYSEFVDEIMAMMCSIGKA